MDNSSQNRLIAEWLGWKNNKYGFFTPAELNPNAAKYPCIPAYTTSDAAAITLIHKLRERFEITLETVITPDEWSITLWREGAEYITYQHPTICGAISGAILGIINRHIDG